MDYVNFDIRLGNLRNDGSYPVAVQSALAGEARGSAAIVIPGHIPQDSPFVPSSVAQWTIKDIGIWLFRTVLSGAPERCYIATRSRLRIDQGIRVRIDALDSLLLSMPWELLYDEEVSDSFLALSLRSPVVRYLELPYPNLSPDLRVPIRILVVTASPCDLPGLNVEAEQARIVAALGPLIRRGDVVVDSLIRASKQSLQAALSKGVDVFHYVGHASRSDVLTALYLENDHRQSMPITVEQLSTLLADGGTTIAVLNACQTANMGPLEVPCGIGASLARSGIPVVIGMRDQMPDAASIIFAERFYGDLADGLPVEGALTEARKAMMLEYGQKAEIWSQPVLFTRVPALAVRPRPPVDPRRYVQVQLSMRLALEAVGRGDSANQRNTLRDVFRLLRPAHINIEITIRKHLGAGVTVISPVSLSVASPPMFQWSIGDDIAIACEKAHQQLGITPMLTAQVTVLDGWQSIWQSPLGSQASFESKSTAIQVSEIREIACPPDIFAALGAHKKLTWLLEITFPIINADGKLGTKKIANMAVFRVLDVQEREALASALASIETELAAPVETAMLRGMVYESFGVYDEAEREYRAALPAQELRFQAGQRLAQVFYKRAYQLLGLPGELPADKPINDFLKEAIEFQRSDLIGTAYG